ncbi:hypothetical protein ACWGKW_40315 [Streptomyces sp. NPDC054766]|uniref:hypothetical protein n=1 Tax=Streptomyces rhizosphaerihabitans TaxID=1266770 RepID=UPI0021C0D941|nr:hypothetical protein [Streptomyces rhizosphaerihabitans]MCT9006857.1 hypothetical protein [Streptomyces rhizosphaerihabitans]
MEDTPNALPEDYESDPEYLAIMARLEKPWWRRSAVLVTGGIAIVAAVFFAGVWVGSSDGSSGTSSPDPWVQGQLDDQSRNNQPQDNQPAGVTAAQKSQLLSRFCTQQAGGPYDVSEAALLECLNTYYVTDQGQVLPK